MKTTLDLKDALLTQAKALAVQQGTSLTKLIEDGLQLRLREAQKFDLAILAAFFIPGLPKDLMAYLATRTQANASRKGKADHGDSKAEKIAK